MRTSKKIVSLILAVMMVVSMMAVMAVSVSAATAQVVNEDDPNANVMYTNAAGTSVKYYTQFPTLSAGTYKVLKDFTQTVRAATGTFGATYTIDLNKKTVTFDVEADGFSFCISHRGGTATITNGGKMICADNADDDRVFNLTGGTLNIENSVTVEGTGDVTPVVITKGTLNTAGKLYAEDSFAIATNGKDSKNFTINVTGGTVKSTNATAIYQPADGELNISGGTIQGTTGVYVKSGTTNITGGTIKGTGADADYDYNGNGCNSTGDALVIDNCGYPGGAPEVNISGGSFTSTNGESVATYTKQDDPDYSTESYATVEPEITGGQFNTDVSQYVDTSDVYYIWESTAGVTKYYTSPLSTTSISSSGTYTLLKDASLTGRLAPGILASNVTLDLNGHTLTSTATDEAFLLSRAGSAAKHNSYTIKNGTVVAAADGVALLADYADLTLENVDIVANGVYGVVTNGTKTGNNITATDSSITAGTLGIYKPSNGSLTLTDTDVTGETAVYVKSGDVTIDGGTFTGTGAAADYQYNGNGANITGDAVVIDNCGYPGGAPTVAIFDGNFSSANGDAVASYVKQDDPTYSSATFDKIDEFISGGTYSSDVTALCDDTFVAVKDASGNYVVIVDPLEDKAEIEGYQIKVVGSSQSTDDAGNDINTKGLRILTKVDNDFLATCDDYGYVVAKVSGKDQATANFSLLTNDGGNGQKVISCKNTSNHGLKDIDNNYVTLAVNGMGDNDQVAVRFYVVKNGVMYSYYTGAMKYNGIIATMPASN